MQRSATAVETSLGGGNHGHLGLVMKDALYQTETGGTAFTIPASGGLLPTFAPGATEEEKRTAVAEFPRLSQVCQQQLPATLKELPQVPPAAH